MQKSMNIRAMLGLAAAAAVVGAAGSASMSPAVGAAPDNVIVRSSAPVTVPYAGPINRQARATCLPSEKVISGGADVTSVAGGTGRGEYFTFIVRDRPLPESPADRSPAAGSRRQQTTAPTSPPRAAKTRCCAPTSSAPRNTLSGLSRARSSCPASAATPVSAAHKDAREQLAELEFAPIAQQQIENHRAPQRRAAHADLELERIAAANRCRALTGHYGIGPLVATAILTRLGDTRRLSSSEQAVRCAGLDITVRESDSAAAPDISPGSAHRCCAGPPPLCQARVRRSAGCFYCV